MILPTQINTGRAMFVGIWRIRVGDVVRMWLGPDNVSVMMKALLERIDVQHAEDRHNRDVTNAYVMHIHAIYVGNKAQMEPTDDKVWVSGDMYRIVGSQSTRDAGGAEGKDRGEPKVPWLSASFRLQRVNCKSVEVVCSVQQLGGRLWASLVSNMLHAERAPATPHKDSESRSTPAPHPRGPHCRFGKSHGGWYRRQAVGATRQGV